MERRVDDELDRLSHVDFPQEVLIAESAPADVNPGDEPPTAPGLKLTRHTHDQYSKRLNNTYRPTPVFPFHAKPVQ